MKKQYAALPFRFRHADLVEILLITTRRKGRWIIPKGWPKLRLPRHQTAAEEAFEEAGLTGRVRSRQVGSFRTRKRMGDRKVKCEIEVFPLAVTDQHRSWPEKGERRRRWMPLNKAAQVVRKKGLRRMLVSLHKNPSRLRIEDFRA
jgi:8-oxo-dGTP pyrophosphatase MutT (NUDIX family)